MSLPCLTQFLDPGLLPRRFRCFSKPKQTAELCKALRSKVEKSLDQGLQLCGTCGCPGVTLRKAFSWVLSHTHTHTPPSQVPQQGPISQNLKQIRSVPDQCIKTATRPRQILVQPPSF